MTKFEVGDEVSYLVSNNLIGTVECIDFDYSLVKWETGRTLWEHNEHLIPMKEKVKLT